MESNTIVFDPINILFYVNVWFLVLFKKFNMDIWVKMVSFQIIQNVLNVKITLVIPKNILNARYRAWIVNYAKYWFLYFKLLIIKVVFSKIFVRSFEIFKTAFQIWHTQDALAKKHEDSKCCTRLLKKTTGIWMIWL